MTLHAALRQTTAHKHIWRNADVESSTGNGQLQDGFIIGAASRIVALAHWAYVSDPTQMSQVAPAPAKVRKSSRVSVKASADWLNPTCQNGARHLQGGPPA